MGRMTTAMWWSGLILLFASGLLFGLAVAQAEAEEPKLMTIQERCWSRWGTNFVMVEACYRNQLEALERLRERGAIPGVSPRSVEAERSVAIRAEAAQAACAKYYAIESVEYGQCVIRVKGAAR
jgi:hypothetical protein